MTTEIWATGLVRGWWKAVVLCQRRETIPHSVYILLKERMSLLQILAFASKWYFHTSIAIA